MRYTVAGKAICYSQTTSKLKCVGVSCRIIYTVFATPPVSLLNLFDYIVLKFNDHNIVKILKNLIFHIKNSLFQAA